ncbi:hypothetical protein DFJ58DRAFT_911898 [Suillus subalutaceus]|uniref:uncharacterized protein n=1 Tax=Suillus subalutaceus TaxID=48586 RepID=UPI001B8816F7|nr:uncharacterized protein DFJ58DRAFT_911898 [Suillus subalutaceus]KAG1865897.1 hypothetical protein DFJ58DRAFT_911898 [Suillus subalutaceus]
MIISEMYLICVSIMRTCTFRSLFQGFFYSDIPIELSSVSQSEDQVLLLFLVRPSLHLRLAFLSLLPMEASSKPTDESLHSYDALPYAQDFDSMISDAKFIGDTRTDFYDRSLTSCKYALVGVACSSIFGCSCIIASIVIFHVHGASGVATTNKAFLTRSEALTTTLTLIVTLCTESIGFVHGISLRSALASESRLHFNTNLRLLTAARGWYNPNGALLNGISALLLIISYSSASLVVCLDVSPESTDLQVVVAGMPLLILGVTLLLQVMIALSAMRAVKILTWSSSSFHLTAALVHHTQLTPATLRCMRCVSDLDTYGGPAKPREVQPSAWHAHPSIRKVVMSLWVIVVAYAGWAALIMYIWDKWTGSYPMASNALTLQTWSFLYNMQSNFIAIGIYGVNHRVGRGFYSISSQMSFETKDSGFMISNPASDGELLVAGPWILMFTAQIWSLCFALIIFACFFTFVALRRPRGPQPAAYGHVQTLANLVDEWSSVMWWGHKEDGISYCHAGRGRAITPLPDVKMDCVYAGSGAESRVPFSGAKYILISVLLWLSLGVLPWLISLIVYIVQIAGGHRDTAQNVRMSGTGSAGQSAVTINGMINIVWQMGGETAEA